MTLGQRIQELRKGLGLSQEELGERMGVSRQAISKWEGDQTIPELDNLIALSKLFGLTVGQLLGVEQPAPASARIVQETPKHQKILLAGMGAFLLVLVVAVAVLWAQVQGLSQQISMEEEYVFNAERTVFDTADYQFSDDGSALDLVLEPVKQLKGWEIIGLTVDGVLSSDPMHDLSFDQRTSSATLPLSELSSGRFVVKAVFREKKTRRTFTATSFAIVIPEGKRAEGDVSSIEVTPITNVASDLPRSVYLSLPDPRFD